jgi:hypothetical protein
MKPEFRAPSIESRDLIAPSLLAVTRPIGRVGGGVPVHPDEQRPSFDENKHKNRHAPTPKELSEGLGNNHPDSDRIVDDYA